MKKKNQVFRHVKILKIWSDIRQDNRKQEKYLTESALKFILKGDPETFVWELSLELFTYHFLLKL